MVEGISATVEAGQTLALVGPTGSGKSTLVSLLPRLFDPPRGTVFIDGTDILDLPTSTLRRVVGVAPQDPFLFSRTVAENVQFGVDGSDATDDPDADGQAAVVNQAMAIARLDKDLAAFPQGADTRVGERGVTLSGGQKQRTALARAIAADPRILVLDDVLSAVDAFTEDEILRGLRDTTRRRTSVIVSHRISTVRHADLILVLEAGRVVERGTHDALVSQGGHYAGLHRKQLLELALEGA